MRANWKTVPISELYEGLFDGPHATPKPTDAGPVFLGIKNVTDDGHLDLSDIRHIAEEDFARWTRRVEPRPGDIVFTYEATLNRYAIIPEGFRGCLGRRMALIRTDPKKVDGGFLFYYFFAPAWREVIKKNMMTGATVDRIPLITFPNFPVSVPPLPVQRRIAGILSAYDELMENSQRRIRILEAMARALYREWFVHFRFPGHEKRSSPAGRGGGEGRGSLVTSPLGDIPKGWEVKKLGEVAEITMGLSPKGDTYNEEGDGTPLVNGPVEFGERFTKQVKWTTAATKFCKEGDLVVCVRGSTTGKYVKSDGVYCLGRGVCGLSSKYQCFVDLLFENELPTLLGQTSGSTFPSWTSPQLKNHPVLSPPFELLARFETLVKPMSDAVLGYSRKIQNLRRTRDLLLLRLLSGQVELETEAA
jgi:type I restriction enzyme S subunit